MSLLKPLLFKKKVKFKIEEETNPINITLKLDRDMIIDEDAFAEALLIKVPNIIGMSIKDAVALLQSKGIKYRLVGKEVIPKQGYVYATNPRVGDAIRVKEELQVMVNDSVSK